MRKPYSEQRELSITSSRYFFWEESPSFPQQIPSDFLTFAPCVFFMKKLGISVKCGHPSDNPPRSSYGSLGEMINIFEHFQFPV